MAKDDEKLIRQLSLVSFLLNRSRPATTREIASVVEGYEDMAESAFARRFFQDRRDLAEVGIVIERAQDAGEDSAEAYYLPQENYHLPDISFSPQELHSLRAALALLRGRFAYERPLQLALACLTHGRSVPEDPESESLVVAMGPDPESDATLGALAKVEEATRRGKTLCFDYYSMHRDTVSRRTVDPYCLIRSTGHWYTVGLDHASGAIRMFRLSRIRGSLAYLGKNARDFRIPSGFDAHDYVARPPWLLAPAQGEAVLRVTSDLAWWVERSYPLVRRLPTGTSSSEGATLAWMEFTTEYSDADALLGWVAGLAPRVELIAPSELRARMRAQLEAIRKAHTTPLEPVEREMR